MPEGERSHHVAPLIDFGAPSTRSRSPVHDVLARIGLDRSLIQGPTVAVPFATELALHADGESLIAPRWVVLHNLDDIKSLIGFSDEEVRRRELPQPPAPDGEWSHGHDFALDALSTEDRGRLQRAARCYVYGVSSTVHASFKPAIERLYCPFQLAVYAGSKLVIEGGATLRVTGTPALLLFETLDIREGGNITIDVPFGIVANTMRTAESKAGLW